MQVRHRWTNLPRRPPHAPTALERAAESSPCGPYISDDHAPRVLHRVAQPISYHKRDRTIAFGQRRDLLDADPGIVPRMDSRKMAQTAA
jgi:hypothetical protein